MTSPCISVVMPVKDATATLRETITSIQAQTFSDFEVLVVDDFSTDSTRELVLGVAAVDARFRYLPGEKPGLVASLNQGLKASKAPFIARMDGDDIMLPARLEQQWKLFESDPSLGVVSCGVESFGEQGIGEGFRLYDAWLNALITHDSMYNARFIESPIAHPSAMVRASLVSEHGGYREMEWPEDYDLWLRFFSKGVRFQKVPEVLLRWRDQPNRTSRVHAAYRPEAFLRCKIAHLLDGPLRDFQRVRIWGAGHWGGRLGKGLIAAGLGVEYFVDIDPKKIGGRRHGAPVISSDGLAPCPEVPLLIAVGRRGARGLIESHLMKSGFVAGRDYFALA